MSFSRITWGKSRLESALYCRDEIEYPDGVSWDMAFLLTTQDVVPQDFGDALDRDNLPGYPTLLAHDGARHVIDAELHLGTLIDNEVDGQPMPGGLGDDLSGLDDEDGVVFTSPLTPAGPATVRVDVAAPAGGAYLDAWVDFNGDFSWAQPGDQILSSLLLTPGVHNLTFQVPDTATAGDSFARFRLSSAGGLSFDGLADDGEVEDHDVTIMGDLAVALTAGNGSDDIVLRRNSDNVEQGFVQGNDTGITFNHLVTGAGDYGGAVTFLGGTDFGNSPARIDVLGTATFGPANTHRVEIGGLVPGRPRLSRAWRGWLPKQDKHLSRLVTRVGQAASTAAIHLRATCESPR